ncbi:MAG: hypothetical protein INR71_00385 [Terriglobus roseus]|nr:hypothetical protein [Terriglobus roseus]
MNKAMGADGTASPTASSELNLEDEEKKVVTAAKTLSSRYDSVEQIPKKTWMQEMSLYSGAATNINLLESFIRPWPLVVYPAVIFAFLGYAITLAWVVAINILSIFVLQAPPYNWKPSINGLINIPGLLGNVFGAIVAGWCVDRYSVWRSRRSGGLFQPEWRLVAIIVPALIVPAGCILFGYGVAETLHWITLFFGCGMISVGLTAVPVIGMTYVSDCYFAVSTDALLLINGLKNIVAFGFL